MISKDGKERSHDRSRKDTYSESSCSVGSDGVELDRNEARDSATR
jgi:hypothetical protein